jgi:fibronectin type 3 domain-containing protein
MRYVITIIFCVIASWAAQAQDTLKIRVRANIKKDMIQLRWAVNSPIAWKQSNRHGFRVERYTVVRNNVVLPVPERVVLTPQPLKPQPLNNWQTLAIANNYAAVIAQALYGEEFQLSDADSKGVSRLIALAQELEQRYLVSMYAADLCYPAALLAGWGLDDKTVKPDERYLYRVISAIPEKTLKVEMGSAYVSLNEYTKLPQPQELTAIFGDKSVLLAWNYGLLSDLYNSYYIEKSNDGKVFKRITDIPLTNMNSKDNVSVQRMFYTDSLANNTSTVYYRLVGVTAFSEEGPASEVVKGQGKNRLMYVPHINRAVPDATGKLEVEWEFDERGNSLLKGFELKRADNANGPFKPVLKNIAADKRKITYDSLQASNYFVIAAIPQEGEPVESFPVLIQPSDTVPPAIPIGLKGIVDSLGVVRLSWTANKEKDILGYRIYRAQTAGEELIPLNDVAVRTNSFTDTVEVRNLNSTIHYAVTALDGRYNQSDKSPAIALEKPELVPPSTPVIANYKATAKGIVLTWITGGEENIGTLRLYRQERGTAENMLVKTFSDVTITQHIDSTVRSNAYYKYTLTVVTKRGLSSAPSPSVTIQAAVTAVRKGEFTSFTARLNRKNKRVDLMWKHDIKDLKQLEIYRSELDKTPSLWKVVKGFETQVYDDSAQPEVQYEYLIRAVLENGKSGATAKAILKR